MAQRSDRQTEQYQRRADDHRAGREGRSEVATLFSVKIIPSCSFVSFVVRIPLPMSKRIGALLLAMFCALMFLGAGEEPPSNNSAEAARLNNLGLAYMNQQLFDKALKKFQDAAKLDPQLQIAQLNQGIALLNRSEER